MAAAADTAVDCPVLKLGDTPNDATRMNPVRAARLVADANERWQPEELTALLEVAADIALAVIERPLPASDEAALRDLTSSVPQCADESAAPGTELTALTERYQAINIKLDKTTGGLSGAITAIAAILAAGCRIMLGTMVSNSLSMAPAAHLAALADWIDVDRPLLLARDDAMTITNGQLSPPTVALWG